MDPQFLYINVDLIPSNMMVGGRLVSVVVPGPGHTVYYPSGQALVYTASGREVVSSTGPSVVRPAYAEVYYPPAPVRAEEPIRRGVIVPDNNTRTMVVTIPEGTVGGSVITAQAPDGTQVQVIELFIYCIRLFFTY